MASAYLTRTPSGAGNGNTWTFSAWVKKSNLSTTQFLIGSSTSASDFEDIRFNANTGDLSYNRYLTNKQWGFDSSAYLRDVSGWYHVVVNRNGTTMNYYLNGVLQTKTNEVTSTSTGDFNTTDELRIGGRPDTTSNTFDGYMAEVCWIDGQQLDPTSFGEFDEDSGIWKPKDVSGLTFGNEGFYLDFENSGSLGADVSGNGNNFTVNNLTSIDQSTDTCTNNFATLNPLDNYYAQATFSEGNLKLVTNTGTYTHNTGTIALSSGKWFWEVKVTSSSSEDIIGIRGDQSRSNYDFNESYDFFYNSYARFYDGSSGSQFVSYGATFTTGDIIGVALDLDSGTNTIQFYKNGSAQGSKNITNVSSTAIGVYNIVLGDYTSGGSATFEINFGSPPYSESGGNSDGNGYGNFSMAVPSGYFALNTKNLAEYG